MSSSRSRAPPRCFVGASSLCQFLSIPLLLFLIVVVSAVTAGVEYAPFKDHLTPFAEKYFAQRELEKKLGTSSLPMGVPYGKTPGQRTPVKAMSALGNEIWGERIHSHADAGGGEEGVYSGALPVDVYLGIPYVPPVERWHNARKFADAAEEKTSLDVRGKGNNYGPVCPMDYKRSQKLGELNEEINRNEIASNKRKNRESQQEQSQSPPVYQVNMDENNCLVLNVIAPPLSNEEKAAGTSLRPVYVFIHGGSLRTGFAPEFGVLGPARNFAASKDNQHEPVVFVFLQYRLSFFGFYNIHRPGAQPEGYAPNRGHNDQLLAIWWVWDNIRNFGGDPNNITIGGQSAGAASSEWLLLTKKLPPGVKQAIIQSGTVELCAEGSAFNIADNRVFILSGEQDAPNANETSTEKQRRDDYLKGIFQKATIQKLLEASRSYGTYDFILGKDGLHRSLPEWGSSDTIGEKLKEIKKVNPQVKSVLYGMMDTEHALFHFGFPLKHLAYDTAFKIFNTAYYIKAMKEQKAHDSGLSIPTTAEPQGAAAEEPAADRKMDNISGFPGSKEFELAMDAMAAPKKWRELEKLEMEKVNIEALTYALFGRRIARHAIALAEAGINVYLYKFKIPGMPNRPDLDKELQKYAPHSADIPRLFLPEWMVAEVPEMRTDDFLAQVDTVVGVWRQFIHTGRVDTLAVPGDGSASYAANLPYLEIVQMDAAAVVGPSLKKVYEARTATEGVDKVANFMPPAMGKFWEKFERIYGTGYIDEPPTLGRLTQLGKFDASTSLDAGIIGFITGSTHFFEHTYPSIKHNVSSIKRRLCEILTPQRNCVPQQ